MAQFNRREIIKGVSGLGLASLSGLGSVLNATAAPRKITNYGVNLYTVRNLVIENMPRTMEQIAEIGYK